MFLYHIWNNFFKKEKEWEEQKVIYNKNGYPLGDFRYSPKYNKWQRWYCFYEGGDWFDCDNPLEEK